MKSQFKPLHRCVAMTTGHWPPPGSGSQGSYKRKRGVFTFGLLYYFRLVCDNVEGGRQSKQTTADADQACVTSGLKPVKGERGT